MRRRLAVLGAVAAAACASVVLLAPTGGAQLLPPILGTTTTAPPPTSPPTTPPTTVPPPTVAPDPAPADTLPPDTIPPDTLPPLGTVAPSPVEAGPATTAPAQAPRAPVATPIGRPVTAAAASTISAATVTGTFGLAVAAVLAAALLLVGAAARHTTPGGHRMHDPTRRWRFLAGVGCLALAAVVGLVGYLQLSTEPQVNRQIPYLASAGMALVLLAAIGGSLLVAEQLRQDDERLDELEAAVRHLADAVAPAIESPARVAEPTPPRRRASTSARR